MLETEHGGIMEAVDDVYAITGDARYLALAKRLNHQSLFEPMTRGEDVLTGLHANAQIPKVIGMERIYQLTGDPAFGKAARFFWDNVVYTRSFAIGGHGAHEFFFAPDAFYSLEMQNGGTQVIHKPLGSGGTSDPLNTVGSLGIKFIYGVAAAPATDYRLIRLGHGVTIRY